MSWRVEQADPAGERWSALLARSDHLLFHRPEWAPVLAEGVSARTCCFLFAEDAEDRAGMLGCVVGGLGVSTGYFSFPYGGIVGTPPDAETLNGLLMDAGRMLGVAQVQLVGYPHEPEGATSTGHARVEDQTNVLPLEGLTPESLLAGYKRVRRQEIKRAMNRGVVIENRTDDEAISAVHRFYLETMARTGGLARYKRELIASAVKHLCPIGRARLTIASHEGEPIAGMLVVDSDEMSHGLLLVASSESRPLEPNKLLLHTAAEQAIGEGKKFLDFMPSGQSAKGVGQFKALWHTTEIPLVHRTVNVRPIRAAMWRGALAAAKREPFRSLIGRVRSGRSAPARQRPTAPDVIVLGNQKSGTTAIARLLAERCGLSATIDLPRGLRRHGFALIRGETTFESFRNRHPELFDARLVKIPPLTFVSDQVAEAFPGARLVGVIRDPRDNLRSLLNRRKLSGSDARPPWHRELMLRLSGSPRYDRSVWGGETWIESLAYRWVRAADALTSLGDRCKVVRYEDFARAKAATIDGLAGDLGLPPRADIASRLDHQFQPAGDRKVSWVEFFGTENLERIESICADPMRRFGYQPCGENVSA